MNEEIAGCFANRIEVRFRQGRYDWLHMRLRARPARQVGALLPHLERLLSVS